MNYASFIALYYHTTSVLWSKRQRHIQKLFFLMEQIIICRKKKMKNLRREINVVCYVFNVVEHKNSSRQYNEEK